MWVPLEETLLRSTLTVTRRFDKKIAPWCMASYKCTSGQHVAIAAQDIKA